MNGDQTLRSLNAEPLERPETKITAPSLGRPTTQTLTNQVKVPSAFQTK